jgi:glycosyltransferase involved in cell wall biosynthesis
VVNRASRGIYYVHFPQPLDSTRQRANQVVSRAAGGLLQRVPGRLGSTSKVRRIREGFERRVIDRSWVETYSDYLANSEYTARWTKKIWGVSSRVVFPAVRPVVEADWARKSPTIATLGRFFDPAHGHCKKQRDLVDGFCLLDDSGRSRVAGDQWRFGLVGGADAPNREYTLGVKRAALGRPIDVNINAPRSVVEETLRSASIYWHGTGYGEEESKHPERFEHFGIAVVEAMLAGCVPLVYGEAGPAEIVRHGVDGYHWHTLEQLAGFTYELMADPAKRRAMAESAVARGREFSLERFRSAIDALL